MVALINTTLLRAMGAVANLKTRLSEERGQDLIEYVVLGGLIALVAATALVILGIAGGPFDVMAETIGNCVSFSDPCG